MPAIMVVCPERGRDAWGEGHWGASRGDRTHMGIDYAAVPGSTLVSPVTGQVTKIGYPYSDDLSYRYVEVTDGRGYRHRFFYVEPGVIMRQTIIAEFSALGVIQDITARYATPKGMTPHFHYEVKDESGFVDPRTV